MVTVTPSVVVQAGCMRRAAQLRADSGRRALHLGLQPAPPVRSALPLWRQCAGARSGAVPGWPESHLRGCRAAPRHCLHRCW